MIYLVYPSPCKTQEATSNAGGKQGIEEVPQLLEGRVCLLESNYVFYGLFLVSSAGKNEPCLCICLCKEEESESPSLLMCMSSEHPHFSLYRLLQGITKVAGQCAFSVFLLLHMTHMRARGLWLGPKGNKHIRQVRQSNVVSTVAEQNSFLFATETALQGRLPSHPHHRQVGIRGPCRHAVRLLSSYAHSSHMWMCMRVNVLNKCILNKCILV